MIGLVCILGGGWIQLAVPLSRLILVPGFTESALSKELVAILIAVSATHTWDVLPALQRALLRKDKIDAAAVASLQRRESILLRWSLVLAALIMLATAFARAS